MTDGYESTLIQLKDRMVVRDRVGINAAILTLIEQNAPLGAQWAALARLLQHHGEHQAALNALDTWLHAVGPEPRILFERGTTLARAGRSAEALRSLNEIPCEFPDAVSNAYLKGTIAHSIGDRDLAVSMLSRAVELNPSSGQSWLARAMADRLDDAEAERLRGAGRFFQNVETADAAAYFYALGKVEDEQGDHEAAFASFARGARTMQGVQAFDAAVDEARVSAEISDWSRAALDETRAAITEDNARPIFVTGLPRSGTTLVEQILASHSTVAGGAELSLFSIIGSDVGGLSYRAFQGWRERGGDPQALRSLYHHLVDQRFPAPGRIVDKTLATSRHMGLIASLFADAPIIWMRRDPLDCAWSAFRNYFIKGVEWSWSLESIADFFRQEDRLFDHWTNMLGDQILVVPFDGLVTGPDDWTRRINEHVGLSLEPAQLAPHHTSRTVTTNSAAQVREAMHARGVGAAEPYLPKLGDFIALYDAR